MAKPMIRTISPSTNQVVCEVPETTLDDIHAIARASQDAFATFSATTFQERRDIVVRAMKMFQVRKMELGKELTMQMGRPIAYSHKEIETMQKRADYLLETAEESLDNIPGKPEAGFQRWLKKVPLGPVLVISAWNFPYLLLVNVLVPAFLTGDTVILKPSPQTPLVAERFLEIFLQAGLPRNVLQVVHSGSAEMVKSLVQAPEIQGVSFTGSTAGGLAVREAAAKRTIPLNLELGGNDPAYVRSDADLRFTAAELVDGAVFNSGQSCCSIERIYAHADIYDVFVGELQTELKSYKLGDPTDESTNVGPVISKASQKAITAQIEDAIAMGATDVTPPIASFQNAPSEGNYISPRILINVTPDMTIMKEETFGPVIPVCKVSSDEKAIGLMNETDYGLTASVWTKDIQRGIEVIDQLEAGTVFMNRADYPSPDLAWTGWKMSGLGCTLGPRAFDFFFKLKSYHVKENQA